MIGWSCRLMVVRERMGMKVVLLVGGVEDESDDGRCRMEEDDAS